MDGGSGWGRDGCGSGTGLVGMVADRWGWGRAEDMEGRSGLTFLLRKWASLGTTQPVLV